MKSFSILIKKKKMFYKTLLLTCIILLNDVVIHAFPQLNVTEDGEILKLYLVGTNPPDVEHGTSFTVQKNNRVYFTTSDAMGPDNFYNPNLLGGSIEYDLDIA